MFEEIRLTDRGREALEEAKKLQKSLPKWAIVPKWMGNVP